jgi:transposase
MSTTTPVSIGVGIDTARYGHHVSFLRADRKPAANEFTFPESPAGYAQLRQAIDQLSKKYDNAHFHIRIDAAGQYAANLERFVRSLPVEKTISIGQTKQNRDYCKVHFPKRKADSVEAQACARFAIVEQPPETPETPAAFAQLRDVCGALEAQVAQSTRLINQLHNRLARVFPELALDVPDLSAQWVLRLLAKYPTPAKLAAARLSSLLGLPHITEDKARKVQAAAQQTVASQRGPVAEELIRHSVEVIQRSKKAEHRLKDLLKDAYDALPDGPHRQIETIPGIGAQTAGALVAKMVNIDRFGKPESVINFFGIFPEENTSGTDKYGRPVPPGTMVMSRKGNDLVRRDLWNAAKTAILHNPPVRALYARQRAAGKRGDVALGHCMRKLLQQVFAVWKTNKPFAPPETTASMEAGIASPQSERTGGRKGQGPERQAVTPAPSNIPSAPDASNAPGSAKTSSPAAGRVEFAELRARITIEEVLRELGAWGHLRGHAAQRRGPCPIHEPSSTDGRSFSVNLDRNIFHCFDASCGAKGNVLDLWAQTRRLTIPEAARELGERFAVNTEQRRGTRQSAQTQGATILR